MPSELYGDIEVCEMVNQFGLQRGSKSYEISGSGTKINAPRQQFIFGFRIQPTNPIAFSTLSKWKFCQFWLWILILFCVFTLLLPKSMMVKVSHLDFLCSQAILYLLFPAVSSSDPCFLTVTILDLCKSSLCSLDSYSQRKLYVVALIGVVLGA